MFHPVIYLNELSLYYDKFYFDIVQVGTGGNGGYLVQRLSKMLHSFSQTKKMNFTFSYTLIDGDKVEQKNLLRQPFITSDIDQPKAKILAERYGQAYDIPIFYQTSYINNADELKQAFQLPPDYSMALYIPILIGCVDNNATRQIMHQVFMDSKRMIYLDAGIDSVLFDKEGNVEIESGYSGQVVCGLRNKGKTILPPVGEVYPDILRDKDSRLPTEACGETIINYPQRMQTNEVAAIVLAGYLNTILGDYQIISHYTNFNARTMLIKPTYIQK